LQLTLVGAGERMSVESESFAAPGAAAVGVVLGDADGTITYLDPTAEGLLGASQAEADGAHWAKVLLGEEDGAGLPIPGELDARACAGGSGVRASIRALPNGAGWLFILQRAEADVEAKYARALAEGLLSATRSPVFVKDRQLRYTHVNQAMADVFGLSPESFVGRTDGEVFSAESQRRSLEWDERVLQGETVTQELRTAVEDVERTYSTVRTPLRSADGSVIGVCGVTQEVTQLHVARKGPGVTRSDYQALAEHVGVGLASLREVSGGEGETPDYVFTDADALWGQITGRTPGEIVGTSLADGAGGLSDEWLETLRAAVRCAGGGRLEHLDDRRGCRYYVEVVRLGEGRALALLQGTPAVSAAACGEDAAAQAARALLEATEQSAVLLTSDGTVLSANASAAGDLGTAPEALVGKKLWDRVSLQEAMALRDSVARVTATLETQHAESERGGCRYAHTVVPVEARDGVVERVAVLTREISGSGAAGEEQRLTTLGRLSGSLAHEFNNILVGMMLRAERARDLDEIDEYRKLGEVVLSGGKRGSDMCRNIQAFGKPGGEGRRSLPVAAVIGDALALCAPQLRSAGIELDARLEDRDGLRANADATELQHAFVNLVLSAGQSMQGGGRLCITVRSGVTSDGHAAVIAAVRAQGAAGEAAAVEGRAPVDREATTGGEAELAAARAIVQEQGGEVQVTGNTGAGTVFEVVLPVHAAHPPSLQDDVQGPSPEGRHRVLLVEDEDELRDLLGEVLSDNGLEPTTVASAAEALDALKTRQWDLVLTDLLMPGGSGHDVVRQAAQDQGPPVIVMTGRVEEAEKARLVATGVAGLLHKPFPLDEMLSLVRRVLARSGQGAEG